MFKRLLAALILIAAGIGPLQAEGSAKRILFVSSYHPAFPSFEKQVSGLRQGLAENGLSGSKVLLDVEFMDTERFAAAEQTQLFRQTLAAKLDRLPRYDVIAVGDDNAFNFALSEQNGMFAGLPIVFLGVNNISRANAQNDNPMMTGVIEKSSGLETLKLMDRLFPDAPRIYIVIEETTRTGIANSRQARQDAQNLAGTDVEFISMSQFSYSELWRHLATLPKDAPILLRGLYLDRLGNRAGFSETLGKIRAATSAPLFSLQQHGIGNGILGGKVINHVEQGRRAGHMVAKIIAGTPVAEIAVLAESPNTVEVDYRELERFGLSASMHPPDTVILNRPSESQLTVYGPWFAGGAIAILLQMALIVFLVRTNRRRKQAELAMRDTQSRLSAFLDNSPSVMLIKDREHRIVMANARYLSLHNVTLDDIIGKRGGSTLSEAEREKMEQADQQVMDSAIPTTSTLEVTQQGGSKRYYNVSKFPVFDADGMVSGIGTINTDISQIHEHEEQLELARAEAEVIAAEAQVANKAKSEFLASMSHEIRTPLNGVLGMATLLLDSELSEDQKTQVETIRSSGGLLLSLLNDILDLSKIEAGKMELEDIDFDTRELLKSVADLWAPKAYAAGIEYSERFDGLTSPILRTDPTRISQILFNFLSNALKFTKAGSVTISVSQSVVDADKIETRFEVRDTGGGIDSDVLPNLFQKFEQADTSITRKHGGTGLGLAISKQLAEAMGGAIGAESHPGQGSTFWFTIVCPEGTTGSVHTLHETEGADQAAEFRQLRILIAEDNDVNQKVITALLARGGHHIDIVGNGIEAVSAVVRGEYDVVLMDVQMPEMDGVTATRRIREMQGAQSQIPIIALTANAMKGDAEKYRAAGMSDYVSKPIEREKLQAAILRQCGTPVDIREPDMTAAAPKKPQILSAELQNDLDELFSDIDSKVG
ncbi:MAG: ABC transporter substrate binding protein [Alphaproteobacteria bacterium]